MINFKNATAALALGFMVAAAATPALARSHAAHHGYNARAQAPTADVDEGFLTPERAKALRDCNDLTAGLKQYTWGVQQGAELRACLSEHGQPE